MTEHKEDIIKIAASAVLLIAAIIINRFCRLPIYLTVLIFAVPYLISAFEVLKEAVENILHGEIFDENFLMSIATIGAFIIGEYPEAVFVMLLFNVGELFEHIATDNSRKSIASLIKIRPDTANLLIDGNIVKTDAKQINTGDIIVVKAGERVPLDGVIVSGSTSLDASALTGESLPVKADTGDSVSSGCINLEGVIEIKVQSKFENSTVTKILNLVQNAGSKKAKPERFIKRFAKVYTPIVVISALLIAIIPSVLTKQVSVWVYRALMFLVVSCPCALVVSVPLGYFSGIGGASKKGILVKSADSLESLSSVKNAVFDKTGTLTKGTFTVTAIHPQKIDEKELLRIAAAAESFSEHPISLSLKSAYGKSCDGMKISNIKETSGFGVSAEIDGKSVLAGNGRLMEKYGIDYRDCHHSGTVVHIAVDGEYCGHIVISDTLKPDSKKTVSALKSTGIKTVMLTGDRKTAAENIAAELSVDEYRAELMPQDKLDILENIIESGKTAFIGDGINDSPCIARADIGISMGALGSDAAIDASDIVLMDDNVSKLLTAIKISRKTHSVVMQNIVFSIAVKSALLVLASFGLLNMWFASFGDVGVLVLAVLNSIRAMKS